MTCDHWRQCGECRKHMHHYWIVASALHDIATVFGNEGFWTSLAGLVDRMRGRALGALERNGR